MFDRERIERRRKMAKDAPEKALSSFAWNETVFQSFQAGYLKSLDFDFYKSLESAIAKRMYRFLDKRFYHRPRWEFDLQTFACEHTGLSKNYPSWDLKRKLWPAVRELEGRGFLAPLPEAERFHQVERGSWRAVFVKAKSKVRALPVDEDEGDATARELVARGITRRSALKLLAHHPRPKIQEKIRLYDGLKARGGEKAIRNRAGWLYSAIVNDYAAPSEMTARRSKAEKQSPMITTATPAAKGDTHPGPQDDEARAFESFWSALTEAERAEFERQAVAEATPFLRKHYDVDGSERGALWAATQRHILQDHFGRAIPTAAQSDTAGRDRAGNPTTTHTLSPMSSKPPGRRKSVTTGGLPRRP